MNAVRWIPWPLVGVALGCSAAPPPPMPPEEPAAPISSPLSPLSGCDSGAECLQLAREQRRSGQTEQAEVLFERGCQHREETACNELAALYVTSQRGKQAETLLAGRCHAEMFGSCYQLAELRRSADPGGALQLYERACLSLPEASSRLALACTAGVLHASAQGERASKERQLSRLCSSIKSSLCKRAEPAPGVAATAAAPCRAGEPGCPVQARSGNPLGLEEANLTMGSVTADGFTLVDFACKATEPGLALLLLGPTVAGSIGQKKAKLHACSPQGPTTVHVRFSARAGKIDKVETAADDRAVRVCVERALIGTTVILEGSCSATLEVGKSVAKP